MSSEPTEYFPQTEADALRKQIEEQNEEDDKREVQERMEWIYEHAADGLDKYPVDLVEDDTVDEGSGDIEDDHVPPVTPQAAPEIFRRRQEPLLTSTPQLQMQQLSLEEGPLDTPDRAAGQDFEKRYLGANFSDQQQLKVLYEARGHEIKRLQEEGRQLQHDKALVTAEKNHLEAEAEQLKESCDSMAQENLALREELQNMIEAMKKQESNKQELIARSEDSENQLRLLQSQVLELQNRDAMVRAKEEKDAIVSSLSRRHDAEMRVKEEEINRLEFRTRELERRLERAEEAAHQRENAFAEATVEKETEADDLRRKLSEVQARLTKALRTDNPGEQRAPMEEICQLRSALAEATQVRKEHEVHIRDLADEVNEAGGKLITAENAAADFQAEVVMLRKKEAESREAASRLKDEVNEAGAKLIIAQKSAVEFQAEVVTLRKKEAESRETASQLKDELDKVGAKLMTAERGAAEFQAEVAMLRRKETEYWETASRLKAEIGQLQAQLRTSVDAAAAHEVEDLMEKLNAKTEELSNHKEKLREVIEKWEDNAQELRKNHCKDKEELEKIKTKHRDLKQKYRTLHKNYSRMEEHYKGEISRQRNEWMVQLEEYKTKMDAAYGAREKKIEEEFQSFRRRVEPLYAVHHLDGIWTENPSPTCERLRHLSTPSTSSALEHPTRGSATYHSSDEENRFADQVKSRSEKVARLFAEVAQNVKAELKRPPPHHLGWQDKRTLLPSNS